jgi:flagellar biosynthesis component FlhA
MCDTVSTSIILGTLALVPGTTSHSVFLALACMSFMLFVARHQGPAQKFNKLEDMIKALEETLERAKAASSYARNHMEVIDAGCRLLQYVQPSMSWQQT